MVEVKHTSRALQEETDGSLVSEQGQLTGHEDMQDTLTPGRVEGLHSFAALTELLNETRICDDAASSTELLLCQLPTRNPVEGGCRLTSNPSQT